MGFFKNLVSKFPCELCGAEVGVLTRTKLRDDKYICFDCTKNCSAFYPTASYSLEEVKKHMEYMKNYDRFCKEVFDKDDKKLDFAKLFQKTGIIFSDKLGMFEIVTHNTKKKNYRELFRYDQIYDYKLYGVENTNENIDKKYIETGVKIKLLSKKDTSWDNMLLNASKTYDEYKHEYALEFTIPCKTSTDFLDGDLILKHLDEIFNVVADGKFIKVVNWTSGRDYYRKMQEIELQFNRNYWKEAADNAEREFFGKTIKEL